MDKLAIANDIVRHVGRFHSKIQKTMELQHWNLLPKQHFNKIKQNKK